MGYRVYAMDTYFYNSIARYPFEVRCEMLAELGYDATYLTAWSEQAWSDVPKLANVKRDYDLDAAAVYGVLDLATGDELEMNRRVYHLIETLEGCPNVELAIKTSPAGSDGDDGVVRVLDRLLAAAERRKLNLLLYPHINFWLERIEDGVRLCRRINH